MCANNTLREAFTLSSWASLGALQVCTLRHTHTAAHAQTCSMQNFSIHSHISLNPNDFHSIPRRGPWLPLMCDFEHSCSNLKKENFLYKNRILNWGGCLLIDGRCFRDHSLTGCCSEGNGNSPPTDSGGTGESCCFSSLDPQPPPHTHTHIPTGRA